jgi:serine/threonine protein kinase
VPLVNGSTLGPYEILARLGAGGVGEAYRARDTRSDQTVALKVLPYVAEGRADMIHGFEQAAQKITALSHPNICALHSVGMQEGVPYLVIEYIEGETLSDRLARGALPFDEVFRIAIQVGEALDHAHRHGIVHRDLKPGNVMLAGAGGGTMVKLLDLGLAKISGSAQAAAAAGSLTSRGTIPQSLTVESSIMGTFQYMSPEQLGGLEGDARSDIFAFGCVLYEMIAGRKAFEGRNHATLMAAIIRSEPQPFTATRPDTPPALALVVWKCLAKNPLDRWQSAHELVAELHRLSESPS